MYLSLYINIALCNISYPAAKQLNISFILQIHLDSIGFDIAISIHVGVFCYSLRNIGVFVKHKYI